VHTTHVWNNPFGIFKLFFISTLKINFRQFSRNFYKFSEKKGVPTPGTLPLDTPMLFRLFLLPNTLNYLVFQCLDFERTDEEEFEDTKGVIPNMCRVHYILYLRFYYTFTYYKKKCFFKGCDKGVMMTSISVTADKHSRNVLSVLYMQISFI
jgi:hypothetical protein